MSESPQPQGPSLPPSSRGGMVAAIGLVVAVALGAVFALAKLGFPSGEARHPRLPVIELRGPQPPLPAPATRRSTAPPKKRPATVRPLRRERTVEPLGGSRTLEDGDREEDQGDQDDDDMDQDTDDGGPDLGTDNDANGDIGPGDPSGPDSGDGNDLDRDRDAGGGDGTD